MIEILLRAKLTNVQITLRHIKLVIALSFVFSHFKVSGTFIALKGLSIRPNHNPIYC